MVRVLRGGVFRVFALTAALTLAFASSAFADTVTNLLDNSPAATQFEEVRVNEGETRAVPFRVISASEDGEDGCNVDAGLEALQLGFNSTNDNIAREDPNGSTITFQDGTDANTNACGPNTSGGADPPAAAPDDRSIIVRGVSRGTADISVAQPPVRNTTGKGTYTYGAATFRVIVQNLAPTANNDSYNTNEDNALTVNAPGVLGNDTDPGNNPLTAVLANPPQNGTLQFNANGSFTYIPSENFTGTDTFTYRTSDGQAESNTATVSINVAAVNDRPDAAPDTLATEEDRPAVVNVLDNDSDVDGGPLTVTSNTQPQNGTVTCTLVGACTYVPNPNFNGVDTFTYTVSDGRGGTATASVTVSVGAANDAPEAADDGYQVAEDDTLNVAGPGVLGNDADPDNDALTARLDQGPGNGTVEFNPDGSFVYTPRADFNGRDSFTYQACDDGTPRICSEPATVEISVEPANDPPVARGTTAVVDEDSRVTVRAIRNDSDADGDPLTITGSTQPQNGTVNCEPGGDCTYVPNPDFNGQDSFTYTITDGRGGTSTATINVNVRPVNDAPTARNDSYTGAEDQPLRVDASGVLGNDSDPENNRLRALLVDGPSNGTVTLAPDGSFVYTPGADFNGQDSFTYRANDDLDDSNVATVTIGVAEANDSPQARDDVATTDEDGPVTVSVQGNDSPGPAGEDQALTTGSITEQPRNGTADINGDGTITYTPNANFSGQDSFTYRVCDDGEPRECATATVNVAVNPINDAPNAGDDRHSVAEDGVLDFPASDLTQNDTPGPDEGGQLSVTRVDDPRHGTVRLENGRVIFVPDPNYNGPASFTYTVCDDGEPRECDTATVVIDVGPANDPPIARDDRGSTNAAALVANSFVSQYASARTTAPTGLFRVDTTRSPYSFGKIGQDVPGPLNAIGYRSTNGSLYGYRMTSSPGIVRVDASTGVSRFMGNPRGLPAASNSYYAGDVSPNGSTYYLYGNRSGVLRAVNLNTFRTRSVNLSSRVNLSDLAVSPVNGRIYGVDPAGRLLEIDPVTGKVTPTAVPALEAGAYGAAWFTAEGDLIVYENGGRPTKDVGGTLVQIKNPTTAPEVAGREAGQSTAGNDGAAFVAPPDPAGLSVEVDVLGNDADDDGALDASTVRVVEPPAHGTTRVNADGSITYTTDSSYLGTDSFRYEVCDDDPVRQCSAATVNITAAPVPGPGTSPVGTPSARQE